MADDHNQRPYRSNGPAGAAPGVASGSDPLAELARLIGQNDPFSEFGRPAAPRAPASDWPQHHAAAPETVAPPPAAQPTAQPLYGAPAFSRQPFGNDLYQVENDAPGYDAPASGGMPGYAQDAAAFEAEPYRAGHSAPFASQFPADAAEHDDFYDDEPPSRRRIGIIAIAGVFALAVIGTAGAFGYRAIFGSSTSSGPPPVIKADTAPSKIVPAAASRDTQANKLISDRVNDRGQGEKLVSREEQPVSVTAVNVPPAQSANSALPQLGSGVVGGEPKRVHTIVIHQDGSAATTPAPEPQPAAAPPPPQRIANPAPAPQQRESAPAPQQRAAPQQAQAVPRQITAQPAPRVQAAPRVVANAPLSLNPNDEASPPPAPRQGAPAQRTAAAAPPTRVAPAAVSGGGGYVVQVSSQRSEADAQSAFRSLQGKFPSQLGGKQPLIKRVDLGDKGIYFRAMVGPFGSSNEASELCSGLKSAGGSCLVQRN
jgi:hypothetical protein